MIKTWPTLIILFLALSQVACAPEVGSEKWCEKMADTPKSDWSTNDASAFAEHCIFKNYVGEDD